MNDIKIQKAELLGSLLLFTRVFFKLLTGREFNLSNPLGNESHFITVCREFHKIIELQQLNTIINLPPGWAKSELCKHFIAWAIARYPYSNFLYISYSHDLAARHTSGIKQILELPQYRNIFDVHVSRDTKAKDYFKTTAGGTVKAFGAKGSITGFDAGLPNFEEFSGAVIMDDMHKPNEVHSDNIREFVNRNYHETIKPRRRGVNVPFILIGQRLHEDDLPANLIKGADGNTWSPLVIQALDSVGNARYPEVHSKEFLLIEQKISPYVFASQYQQDPMPAGGGIFNPEWFVKLNDEPNLLVTFITADTAESDKNYNDATVFSFWGLYRLPTTELALHWIDCLEIRVEPKDLEDEFQAFYSQCMMHPIPPSLAAIEKKSTGVTLVSVLNAKQGLRIIDIGRSSAKNQGAISKIDRFLGMQRFIASKRVSLPSYAPHTEMCIEHMRKITANNSHRFDDIADTLYDAVKIGLIDKGNLFNIDTQSHKSTVLSNYLANVHRSTQRRREREYGNKRYR